MISEKNTVVIYNESCFAFEEDGAQARVAAMLDRVCKDFDRVVVYSYINHHRYPWTESNFEIFRRRWPKVNLILDHYGPVLRIAAAAKNFLISLFPSHASALIKLSIPFCAPAFKTINHAGAVYIVNHKFGLTQLNGVDPSFCLVDTHDLLWLKAARLGNIPTSSLGILRKLRGEIAALSTVRAVLAISPVETAFFKLVLSNTITFYVPLWETMYEVSTPQSSPFDFDLVFVASDYVMNIRGFCKLLEIHGHWINKYKIAVCGNVCNNPDIIAIASSHKNIELLGFVKDLETVYRRSKAAIAPVEGTGLKIKIVSALKSGLPAFAIDQAMEGLPPGYEKSVFPIGQHIIDLIIEDEAALQIAKAAAVNYYMSFIDVGESTQVIAEIGKMINRPQTPSI